MILKDNCDILLYYSFWDNKNVHGVSGHLFEMLDYYWYLKHFLKVKCLFQGMKEKDLEFFLDRFNYTFDFNDFYFCTPDLISVKSSLNLDGSYVFFQRKIITGKKLGFSCGGPMVQYADQRPTDVIFLEDQRIYDKYQNSINYRKKLAFSIMKRPESFNDRTFAHLTSNCKKTELEPLLEKYSNLLAYSNYLPESYNVTRTPVKFGEFNRFVYTPVPRKFDCSCRLIAECDYLGIPVDYFNINYFDKGLEARKFDIENKQVELTLDDDLIKILETLI